MRRRWFGAAGAVAAAGAVVAGVVGIGTASAQPQLPPVSPEDLVASVMTAQPGPFNGTVGIDNELGLPALPGAPQLGNGQQSARVWSGGDGKGRVALPSGDGEKTLVSDGTTRWVYDATDRTATRSTGGAPEQKDPQTDPAGASAQIIGDLRKTSQVAVDGTAEVAGRPAYTLVLTPQPSERTMLREVRVAVDAEKRIPLQLTVLATGSATPALQIGFDDVTFGPQDPSLFTFTPPPGTTVKDAPARGQGAPGAPDRQGPPQGSRTVGDGWDRVVVFQRPAQQPGRQAPQGAPDLNALGTPVTGPFGNGRAITTAVGTAIVTDDGRVAVGAVPEPVVAEALGTK
ncbi:LolA family protein [Actinomycetospora chiangmaiensis]|uniref:LolA family protein n=1 Tax=Actinomycetospora chiangmaiensis TaxID=402650 RepID=UPI0003A34638|nr:outer membrane lipoprotein carrier protein LolA [Actinomycetospora chiangmaiensis]